VIDEQEWLEAWSNWPTEKLLSLTHPEVEVDAVTLGIEPRHYSGHDGIRQWQSDVRERFNARTRAERIERLGDDAVLITGTLSVKQELTGEVEQQPFALVVHVEDDQARWIGTFMSVEDARTAFNTGVTGPRPR
jgi:hypothetical protein